MNSHVTPSVSSAVVRFAASALEIRLISTVRPTFLESVFGEPNGWDEILSHVEFETFSDLFSATEGGSGRGRARERERERVRERERDTGMGENAPRCRDIVKCLREVGLIYINL
jgi:hypothetical protein